jgi:hypothetical protein
MFYKVMGIACDTDKCGNTLQIDGTDATMKQVKDQARLGGWSVSEAGHYCPQHRRRARK